MTHQQFIDASALERSVSVHHGPRQLFAAECARRAPYCLDDGFVAGAPQDLRTAFAEAVYAATGGRPDVIEYDVIQRFATSEKRGDAAGWSRLFSDGRAGVYGCWRSGIQDVWHAVCVDDRTTRRVDLRREVQRVRAMYEEQAEKDRARAADRNARTWAECKTVARGDPVDLYLRRRLATEDLVVPACLRFHCALKYWHGKACVGTWPAMVAPLVNADGDIVALHRTWLTDDGFKADVPGPVKKLSSVSGSLTGTYVPLHQPENSCIGIAEGIETALAAAAASKIPTVAAYAAHNLSAYRWPAGLDILVIFADNDDAGATAAQTLKLAALRSGLSAVVRAPTEPGTDWCDVWASRTSTLNG